MSSLPDPLDISSLLDAYRQGAAEPRSVVAALIDRIKTDADPAVWIHPCTLADLEPYLARLETASPSELPLYGIPFAIKDNIDLAGVPTTAACPAYAYVPSRSALVVDRLIEAGAVPLGKTNLDQFATGLVGTRSPYGTPRNPFHEDYIPGGSSSGSAVAVALGQVSFALGTDTAGSGRIPAAFNNLVGLKPTRGILSTRGVVPACRTLDCVSVFSLCCADAQRVLRVAQIYDAEDPFAREAPDPTGGSSLAAGEFCFGTPSADQLDFFGDDSACRCYAEAVARLRGLGGRRVEVDFQPFMEAARLLYEGPWVAERYAAVQDFLEAHPEELHPVTRRIIAGGAQPTAAQAFQAIYRLAELRRRADRAWPGLDFMVIPTAGTIYRVAEVQNDPLQLNSNLGRYTNFMNLLDLAAVAVPAGFLDNELPFGVTFLAPAGADMPLLSMADRFHRAQNLPLGRQRGRSSAAPEVELVEDRISLAVCGAHMRGMPLNHQLIALQGKFERATRTAPRYRFYALAGTTPPKPGLVRDEKGQAIEIEIWSLRAEAFGRFVSVIPHPLCIGKVETEEGEWVSGFLCEPEGLMGAAEITHLGGWRAYARA